MKARIVTFVKFGLVGAVNTLFSYAISIVLFYILNIPEPAAQAAGYLCGCVSSFLLNGKFTFKTKGSVIKFAVVNILSLIAGAALAAFWSAAGIEYRIASIITTAVTMLINFIGYRLWVYKAYNQEHTD
ncbi:MAG: GtrA family protein [Oscillospiraceae bacterium]|nr:GtrA family protein [Oscillospiraceae bacterium]